MLVENFTILMKELTRVERQQNDAETPYEMKEQDKVLRGMKTVTIQKKIH